MPIFNHQHPKIAKVTSSFHEFASTHQKSIYFIHFSSTYSHIYSPENSVTIPIFDHAHFWPCPLQYFSISFFFSWNCINLQKKTGFLIILFYRYSWFKNPVIWFAKRILAHISRIRFFPKLLAFLNLYQHEKNELIWSIHYWDTADFRVSRPKNPHPFLTNTMQKLLVTFKFPDFLSTHQKSAYSIDSFLRYSQF